MVRFFPALLALFFGLVLSVSLFFYAKEWERTRFEAEIQRLAGDRATRANLRADRIWNRSWQPWFFLCGGVLFTLTVGFHWLGALRRERRIAQGFALQTRNLAEANGRLQTQIIVRKRAEQTQRRFVAILEETTDLVSMSDQTGKVLYINKAGRELLGLADEVNVTRLNLASFLSEAARKTMFEEGIPTAVQTGAWTGESTFRRLDGAEVPVSQVILSHYGPRGELAFVSTISRDISDAKKIEKSLIQARESALDASRLKSEFLACMSHEVRTPLNGVIGMTGLLLDTRLDDEQREYAENVRTSADALLAIVNDILDFSKIEAGKLAIEAIDFDLETAVDEVIDLLGSRVEQKGLRLVLRGAPGVPRRVHGDPGRIRQVLVNLLGNAVKFTEKGHITLAIECPERGRDSALLRFIVEDTGIGIPAGKLDVLFEKFVQAEASTTRRFGGTGLGLAISKQLVELMGGKIGLTSRFGEGSRFWFELNLPTVAGAERKGPSERPIKGARALVASDHGPTREVLKEQLELLGASCDPSGSAGEAMASIRTAAGGGSPYHIALIDGRIADLDVAAFGQAIRGGAGHPSTKTLLLLPRGRQGGVLPWRQSGFVACLPSPVVPSALKELLESLDLALPSAQTTWKPRASEMWQAKSPSRAVPKEKNARRKSPRVLVVEDNIVNQKITIAMLKSLGFSADAAADGSEAVRMVQALPYDVVLMDCDMPIMDGFEATREIRRRAGAAKRIPIIAVTAHAMKGDRERCIEAGMDDYLAKPVGKEELSRTVEKYMGERTPLLATRIDAS